jgi:hypothetical protein
MPNQGWQRRFEESIKFDGRQLETLRDAATIPSRCPRGPRDRSRRTPREINRLLLASKLAPTSRCVQ